MNDAKLFISNHHELRQIEAGTLRAFVRPMEPQPEWDEEPTLHLGIWKGRFVYRSYHGPDDCEEGVDVCESTSPHQPGDVLAVAEEWLRPLTAEYLTFTFRPACSRESAETMPPELARHHLRITEVRPARVTQLTEGDMINLGFTWDYDVLAGRVHTCTMVLREFAGHWDATYPPLPFSEGPWAWLYRCELKKGE